MLNMDMSKAVTINTTDMEWLASPHSGVWRKPLSREDAERGHATSIVRYDANASFHSHNHPLGEEILVLSGTFSDETGDFHAGTYFRNPAGFIHAPFSKDGCVILVKLHQFQADDSKRVALQTGQMPWLDVAQGAEIIMLHEHNNENVVMVKLQANAPGISHEHPLGEEIFVLSGEIQDADGVYPAGTWLRRPPGSQHTPAATKDALLWVKSGHLLTA